MTETERERTARYKADPMFRQWASPLMRFSRANKAPGATQLWNEAEQAAIRLAHETAWRDGEVEFIYADLSDKYGRGSRTPACVMAVLLTLLADAAPKGDAEARSPHAPVERAIVNILGEDVTFNGLLDDFFARRLDNQMRKVEFPVTDYLENLKDTEPEAPEENSALPAGAEALERMVANALRKADVSELKALELNLYELNNPSLTTGWIEQINARIEQLMQAQGTPRVVENNGTCILNNQGPVNGDIKDQKLFMPETRNRLIEQNQ